jgi:hypothetical protein
VLVTRLIDPGRSGVMKKNERDCEYWSFEATTSAKYAEVHSPIDSIGNPFTFHQSVDLPLDLTCECTDGRKALADIIRCIGGSVILSSKAADVFRAFRLGKTTSFVPVVIAAADTRQEIGKAELLVSEMFDFVDVQHSCFVPIAKGSTIPLYFTAPPAVFKDKLAGLDFAYGFGVKRLCSNALRLAILKEKLTNFVFEPLDAR